MVVLVNKKKMNEKETLKDWAVAFITIGSAVFFIYLIVQSFISLGLIKLHTSDSLPVCLANINGGYQVLMVNVVDDDYNCNEGTDLYIIPAYKTVVK